MTSITHGVFGALEACFSGGSVRIKSVAPLELRGPFGRSEPRLFYLRNVTAGIFGGDSYDVNLSASSGADCQIASSSATKVFKAQGATADVSTRIEVLKGAHFVYGPHATILQSGASLRQETRCTVRDGASGVLAEVLSFGRLASGERLDFERYESELTIEVAGRGPLHEERYTLQPGDALKTMLHGYGALACVYAVGVSMQVEETLLEACDGSEFAGCSPLPGGAGFVVKGLTTSLSAGLALCAAVTKALALHRERACSPETLMEP